MEYFAPQSYFGWGAYPVVELFKGCATTGHTQGHFIVSLGMILKTKNWVYQIASFIFIFLNLLIHKALADPPESGQGGVIRRGPLTLENPLGTENIIDVINGVLNYLIYISVPILAFMILWGGFQILAARDDPEKVKNGRKTIQWAVLGFAIILISKGVALVLLTILKG